MPRPVRGALGDAGKDGLVTLSRVAPGDSSPPLVAPLLTLASLGIPLQCSLALSLCSRCLHPIRPALDPTGNGVDGRHHQQHRRGEVEVPAQGHLDEESSREDVSLQRAGTQESRSPEALAVATSIASCSATASTVSPPPTVTVTVSLKGPAEGEPDLADAEEP